MSAIDNIDCVVIYAYSIADSYQNIQEIRLPPTGRNVDITQPVPRKALFNLAYQMLRFHLLRVFAGFIMSLAFDFSFEMAELCD
jgi:hypothetical protein